MSKILFFNDTTYWRDKMSNHDVVAQPLYRNIPKFLRPLRILHFNFNFPLKSLWLNIPPDLDQYEIIILEANYFSRLLVDIFEKKVNKRVRLIYWYWNPVREGFSPKHIGSRWEKWSFDKNDCFEFNLNYNSTYYFRQFHLPKKEIIKDIFFIGRDKGRLGYLLDLEKNLKEYGLKTDFHIVGDDNSRKNKNYKNSLLYNEVLEKISKSRAILEIMQDKQTGLTLRSMEAIFFKKKLITNNKSIIEYNFYRKENIFILGEDPIESIRDFIKSSQIELEKEIIEQYDFRSWIQRLENKCILKDGIQEKIN